MVQRTPNPKPHNPERVQGSGFRDKEPPKWYSHETLSIEDMGDRVSVGVVTLNPKP